MDSFSVTILLCIICFAVGINLGYYLALHHKPSSKLEAKPERLA